MVEYGNNDTIYSHAKEVFNDNRVESFKKKVFSLNKDGAKYKINFLGTYKNVYVFTIAP